MYDLRILTNVSGHLVAFVNDEVVATAIPSHAHWSVKVGNSQPRFLTADDMRIALVDAQIERMRELSESGQVGSLECGGSIEG